MTDTLPAEAYAAALAAVTVFGPARLRRLLRRWTPEEAWRAVSAGRGAPVWTAGLPMKEARALEAKVAALTRRIEPDRLWQRCQALAVRVHPLGSVGYPTCLTLDIDPPAILFSRGDLAALDGRRVTVVGTRNATAAGCEVAAELGAGLSAHSVRVVSGLARGIDGWAHRGALSVDAGAPPVGVVASGLDVVYPREHHALWADVVERGVLLSEVPPGVAPHAFRFPLRNRILAALGELVVVVESRARGGSLVTAAEATRRGVDILAVPGSPKNPAADGVNQLLIDGAIPVVGPADVLVALGFARPEDRRRRPAHLDEVAEDDRWAVELLGTDGLDLDALVQLSGRPLVEVASTMGRLEAGGSVERRGSWFERATPGVGWRR